MWKRFIDERTLAFDYLAWTAQIALLRDRSLLVRTKNAIIDSAKRMGCIVSSLLRCQR